MSNIAALNNIADIAFTDSKTLEEIETEMVSAYETALSSETGSAATLAAAAPMRMALNAAAVQIYAAKQYIERAGKQNLLKYSYGDFLENIAALKGLTRKAAMAATTTLRFTLSAAQASAVGIPAGTRATGGTGLYFATTAYAEVAAGATYVDVAARCTTTGSDGNGLPVGAVSTIVDPVGYVASVSNTTASAGGSDLESDDDLRYRVYLAPSGYSTAGPAAAYEYWVKSYNSEIGDVVVTPGSTDGTVLITLLMEDGALPSAEIISGVSGSLKDGNVRPLTDKVTVQAPTEVSYTIGLTYYIAQSDSAQASAIQTVVSAAVTAYTTWQRKMGRDINPDKLLALIISAGAKRATITTPTQTTIAATEVPALSGTASVTYGGLEAD
jgi:phage-related baseplate assembly protein